MSTIDNPERADGQARSTSSSPPYTYQVEQQPAHQNSHGPRQSQNGNMERDNDMTDDMNEDMSQQAPIKTKGRGRGKAAYPKGGENTPASAYTGHKIKHLKKDDGEPLWRKDIQYDFLREIFMDKQAVFTNSYEPDKPLQTFADLYIDTMARSSKTSKILRDKLLTEHEPAKNMAMVCLLVNLGRMNTTLNFFPEMRAQLRTYHAIPSLQAHQDPNSYKQLQDAPRLKSILKGASEDRLEPNTIEKIKDKEVPRTNPVNLIFVLAQYSQRITELHFPQGHDFYDLIMRTELSSKSRGQAFLWLMWHYLQSDFTEEGCEENPFGAGVDYDMHVSNQGVPRMIELTPAQEAAENVDPPEEIEFGVIKERERRRIIQADMAALPEVGPPKRGPKPKLNLAALEAGESPLPLSKNRTKTYETENESVRSTPPRGVPGRKPGSARMHGPTPIKHQLESSPAPSPHVDSHPAQRRARPLTAHQLAVEQSRNEHVNHILSRGLKKAHHVARKTRKREGAILRAVQRTALLGQQMCEDSEDESLQMRNPGPFKERGLGGLVQLKGEPDDYGEEMLAYATAIKRANRRLVRWEGDEGWKDRLHRAATSEDIAKRLEWEKEDDRQRRDIGLPTRWERKHREMEMEMDAQNAEPELPPPLPQLENVKMEEGGQEEDSLSDVEKTLLGLDQPADEGEDVGEGEEEDLDDMDKQLLGLDGDESDEASRMDVD